MDAIGIAIASAMVVFGAISIGGRSVRGTNTSGLGLMAISGLGGGAVLLQQSEGPTARAIQLSMLGLIVALSILSIAADVRRGGAGRIRWSTLMPALIAGYCFLVNAILNASSDVGDLLMRLAPVALLAAIGVVASVARVDGTALTMAFGLAIAITGVLAFSSSAVWRPCDTFKCGPFGAIYVGPFQSENYLGQLLGVGLLLVLMNWQGMRRVAGIACVALPLIATGSRTSWLAVGIAALVYVVMGSKILQRVLRGVRSRRLLVATTVIAGLGVAWFILVTADPMDFSNRGRFWGLALQALQGSEMFGLGADTWTALQATGYLPALFPHSQLLLMFFWGGLVACALWAVLLFKAPDQRSGSTFRSTFPLLVLFLAMSMTEVVWNPLAVDGHVVFILPLIALARAVSRSESGESSESNGRRGAKDVAAGS